jgi:hypothetical protein
MDRQPDYRDEPEEERRRRSEITIGEVVEQEIGTGETDFSFPEEPLDLDAVVARIGPKRWEELRRRRDALIAQLRLREEDNRGG